MRYREGDRVTVVNDTTVELIDVTVRFPAGMELEVLDVRGDEIQVIDVGRADEVWIHAKFVRPA